jgi:hypothetical protein
MSLAQIQEQFRIWQQTPPDKREKVAAAQASMQVVDLREIMDTQKSLDAISPNGKRMGNLTHEELMELSEWYRQLGEAHMTCAELIEENIRRRS